MKKNREQLTRLEKIRKSKRLTREQLAAITCLSRQSIQKLEDGEMKFSEMKLSTLLKLSKGLRVKPTELLPLDIARKLK